MSLDKSHLLCLTSLIFVIWFHYPRFAIVEETLTSEEYVSLFLISILNMYIWNFNIYIPIQLIFKEKCTNCQPEKITQVKRTNAPFLLLFSNNIKRSLDFYYYSQFYMATFQTATHGKHATLNGYLSFWCIY